jgi:hypothetical protein
VISLAFTLVVDDERQRLLVGGEAIATISLGVLRSSEDARTAWQAMLGAAILAQVEKAAEGET